MPLSFADSDASSIPLHLIEEADFAAFLETQSPQARAMLKAQRFEAGLGALALVFHPETGALSYACGGMGTVATRARSRLHLARFRAGLPEGTYRAEPFGGLKLVEPDYLGWLLDGYRFSRYRADPAPKARLQRPEGIDAHRLELMAAGECLSRDLINTPARDMGPEELEVAAREVARVGGAEITVLTGDMIETRFPLIHAVGAASPRAPRLIDMSWGREGPLLTLVGKGVCFDTGGLDIKPASGMEIMKKDMGGAATVLGLAVMIMGLSPKLRLRVLIPAVENAIDGNAMRPKDIVKSRKGLTVEINNTDAEGRLILADALAYADEGAPDLIISMATLTGAARVAVGPDLAPFFASDKGMAQALMRAGEVAADPVWEMPFWTPYESMIEPGIADLDNAPSGGFAGAITAALFLKRFVSPGRAYLHFDIYGWQPAAAPGRPKGGAAQGGRALLQALPELLHL